MDAFNCTDGISSLVIYKMHGYMQAVNVRLSRWHKLNRRSRQRLSQVSADPILSVGSEGIKPISSTKTLGVVVNECIISRHHVRKVAKKAAQGIRVLRRDLNIYLTEIRLKEFIMPLFYLSLITVLWYEIIVPKHYKTNCKNSKIKPVELSQVIPIKLIQKLSDLNFLGTLRNQKGETTRNLYDSYNER